MKKLGFLVVAAALSTGCQWKGDGTDELIPDPFGTGDQVRASVRPDPRAFGVPQMVSKDAADVALAEDRSHVLPKFDFDKAPAEGHHGVPGGHERVGPHDVAPATGDHGSAHGTEQHH